MVGNNVLEKIKPEQGKLGQDASLLGDPGGQHVVKGRDAVSGDKQEVIRINLVDVADFAAGVKLKVGNVGMEKYARRFRCLYHCLALIGYLSWRNCICPAMFVNGVQENTEMAVDDFSEKFLTERRVPRNPHGQWLSAKSVITGGPPRGAENCGRRRNCKEQTCGRVSSIFLHAA